MRAGIGIASSTSRLIDCVGMVAVVIVVVAVVAVTIHVGVVGILLRTAHHLDIIIVMCANTRSTRTTPRWFCVVGIVVVFTVCVKAMLIMVIMTLLRIGIVYQYRRSSCCRGGSTIRAESGGEGITGRRNTRTGTATRSCAIIPFCEGA